MSAQDHMPSDPKDAAILRSAFLAFSRYGLRRTSMEDIAKGAGMSRPALYLHYAGKEDIFKALVRRHFAQAEQAVSLVLAAGAGPEKTLLGVLHAIDGDAAEAMLNSPHADEILTAESGFDQDEVQQAHARITAKLAHWIAAGVSDGHLDLGGLGGSAAEVAEAFMACKYGLKAHSKDFAAYRRAEEVLASIYAKALSR
jgi:AcrR family transcriptional regulator